MGATCHELNWTKCWRMWRRRRSQTSNSCSANPNLFPCLHPQPIGERQDRAPEHQRIHEVIQPFNFLASVWIGHTRDKHGQIDKCHEHKDRDTKKCGGGAGLLSKHDACTGNEQDYSCDVVDNVACRDPEGRLLLERNDGQAFRMKEMLD